MALADLLRGLAAICIVWHHLSLYAPQSDLADQFAPTLGYNLFNRALYAVAVFFILGGLTSSVDKRIRTSSSESRNSPGVSWHNLVRDLLQRYLRLALPYLAMLLLLHLASWGSNYLGKPLNQIEDWSWPKFVSHFLFMQDLLGFGNFSAGTWYLCIEFQWSCFVLLLAYLASCLEKGSNADRSNSVLVRTAVLFPIGIASAWYWSRNHEWEASFLFFASQYILGVFLGWNLQNRLPTWMLLVYSFGIGASLLVNPRPQMFASILIACTLWIGTKWTIGWKLPRTMSWLSEISYSLFLTHYLINGIVFLAIDSWASQSPGNAAGAMMIAFTISLLVAHIFHRYVEAPTNRWSKQVLLPKQIHS